MATLKVNTTATATIGGVTRTFSSSKTSTATNIVDIDAKLDFGDVPAELFSVTPETKGGSALESFKFLGMKNAGEVPLEIMIKVLQYRDNSTEDAFAATSGAFHQQPYISTLINPGEHTIFTNPRMLIYNEDIGGSAPESAARAKTVNGFADDTKTVDSGTNRGPTDGSGYATSATYFTETDTGGIVPGSIIINFYAAGYQEVGLTNTTNKRDSVSATSDTNVALNTAYAFNITVDGGSAQTIAFTTDTSNAALGNPEDSTDTGVLSKIQAALDNNNVTRGVTARIVGGDIRFTSNTRLNTSAIALAAPGSGTTIWGVGIFPAIGNVDGAVAAALEATSTIGAAQTLIEGSTTHLMLDNGDGTLTRKEGGYGYVDYDEGGTITLHNCPKNATFQLTYYYDSAHSGEITNHATRGNIMYTIYARSTSIGKQGRIKLTAFN